VPGLARLDRVAVLASANGRVIASNSPRLVPGTVLGVERADWQQVADAGAVAGLPWALLQGGMRERRVVARAANDTR